MWEFDRRTLLCYSGMAAASLMLRRSELEGCAALAELRVCGRGALPAAGNLIDGECCAWRMICAEIGGLDEAVGFGFAVRGLGGVSCGGAWGHCGTGWSRGSYGGHGADARRREFEGGCGAGGAAGGEPHDPV